VENYQKMVLSSNWAYALGRGIMSETAIRNPVARFLKFGARDAHRDKTKGRRDGTLGFPALDSDSYSPYELEVVNESRLALAKYYANIDSERGRLTADLEIKKKGFSLL
ncbi:MAG: hypothetical protein ACHQIH_01680, partial [Ignavibacteria bacterium]